MNRVAPLLLTLSLLTTAGACFAVESSEPEFEQQENRQQDEGSKTEPDPTTAEDALSGLKDRIFELETSQEVANTGLLGIPYPLLFAGGSGLIGLIALVLAIAALIRVQKQKAAIGQLRRKNQSLVTRLGGVEVQLEQERIQNQSRSAQAEETVTLARATPTPISRPAPDPIRANVPDVPLKSTPAAPVPVVFNKEGLISALNGGDRQPLREAATAELNITSESENAIATGRSVNTELEVVPGGGSYWLVVLQGEAWLFPTERTLSGFAAAQPSKGLFHYEQQTIAKPLLLEPAALEGSGTRWSVKCMGRIGTP